MRVYLAGPISGKSYEDVMEMFESKVAPLKTAGCEVLHPMLGKENLRNELEFRAHGYNQPTSTNHAIVERDHWMVERSDVVLADLSGAERVSIGTCFELAWASQLGKHTVVVIPKAPHPHDHAFILEAADVIFHDTDDALKYLGVIN